MSDKQTTPKCLVCRGDLMTAEMPITSGINLPIRFKEGFAHLSLSVLMAEDDTALPRMVPVLCRLCQMRAARAAARSLCKDEKGK